MISSIHWPQHHSDEFLTPFERGKGERPLRITLHGQTLHNLSKEELIALDVIKEFVQVENVISIMATDQEPGIPYFSVSAEINDGYRYTTYYQEIGAQPGINIGVHTSQISDERISRLSGGYFPGDTEKLNRVRDDLMFAEAHRSLDRDIFVTGSQWLVAHRDQLADLNICHPSEAVKVLGLVLRSRDCWIYQRTGKWRLVASRQEFYWKLARAKLPAMWRYFSACVHSQKFSDNNIYDLGHSILVRCTRALQARDEIGHRFYLRPSMETQDDILYHFDYLTLLLSGIFDAQAMVAKVVYDVVHSDFDTSFKAKKGERKSFLDKLKDKDSILHSKIASEKNQALLLLLSALRNTIHDVALTIDNTNRISGKKESSLIYIPDKRRKDFSEGLEALGGRDDWGIFTDGEKSFLKPYMFAIQLVNGCFSLYDEIAKITEIERLFEGRSFPELSQCPPEDWLPSMRRFSILG
jgi:hypothetical protein